jgi:uncharacterized membrane protein YfcA
VTELLTYGLVFVAAMAAGVINVLAGSGSLLTLPALVFLGLPSPVANGTNRVGIVVQCLVGAETYRRGGKLRIEGSHWLIGPTLAGALVGAWIATLLTADQMDTAIGVVMVCMLFVLVLDPSTWLREESDLAEGRPSWWMIAVFFVVGVYAGFIQAGVGIMLMAALVLGAGYEVVEASAIKMVMAVIFTSGALAVFVLSDKVNWTYGAFMAVGQGLGAWIGARFAVESNRAAVWIRRLLIAVVVVSAAKFFGLLDLMW